MGRSRSYALDTRADNSQTRSATNAAGLTTTTERDRDRDTVTTFPDGVVTRTTMAADPRFGLASLYPTRIETVMPSGLTRVEELQRSVSLADPSDPLSMTAWTEQRLVNGRLWTSSYDVATRLQTVTSPTGLVTTQTFNAQGDLAGMEAPGVVPWAFGYDNEGKLTSTTQTDGVTTRSTTLTCAPTGGQGAVLAVYQDCGVRQPARIGLEGEGPRWTGGVL